MTTIRMKQDLQEWSFTLANLELPFIGESLIGYLLRMDYINKLPPGRIIELCYYFNKHKLNSTYERIRHFERHYLYTTVSRLLNIPEHYLYELSFRCIEKKLYNYNSSFSSRCLNFELKICPICIQEWKIPIIFFMKNINTCLIHGVKLIDRCTCGKHIDIFKSESVLCCSNKSCEKPYIELVENQNFYDMGIQYCIQSIYSTYLQDHTPFVHYNEKVITRLNKRIEFLDRIRIKATNYIRKTFPIIMYVQKNILGRHNGKYPEKRFYFPSIITILFEFSITPYQFLNLNIPNVAHYSVSIIDINKLGLPLADLNKEKNSKLKRRISSRAFGRYNMKKGITKFADILPIVNKHEEHISGHVAVKVNDSLFTLKFVIKRHSDDSGILFI